MRLCGLCVYLSNSELSYHHFLELSHVYANTANTQKAIAVYGGASRPWVFSNDIDTRRIGGQIERKFLSIVILRSIFPLSTKDVPVRKLLSMMMLTLIFYVNTQTQFARSGPFHEGVLFSRRACCFAGSSLSLRAFVFRTFKSRGTVLSVW